MPDTTPTLPGFTTFCRNVAGINTDVVPDNDPGFQDALTFALAWVPLSMQCMSGLLYTACVYNLGVSMLVNYQPDQEGQTFFTTLRSTYKVSNFVPGVVTNTSDNGTSTGLTVGTQLANLSLFDLQTMADPFGRRAMALMGELGPSSWGIS